MQAVSELEIGQSELEIYQAGELTVLGFGGREILHDFNLTEHRDEILELVRVHNCKALALDLTAVHSIPGGLPGLIQCLLRQHIELHLYNASSEIRAMLTFSNLDHRVSLHELDLDC